MSLLESPWLNHSCEGVTQAEWWDAVAHMHKLVCETSENCDDRKVMETGTEPACRDTES